MNGICINCNEEYSEAGYHGVCDICSGFPLMSVKELKAYKMNILKEYKDTIRKINKEIDKR